MSVESINSIDISNMDGSLQEQWPEPEAELGLHREYLLRGVALMRHRLVMPPDERLEIAYAAQISVPGQEASVSTKGDPATGKTTYGDMLYGRQYRTEISAKDTEATLYGHRNPINISEYVPGKLKGLQPVNGRPPANPVVYGNEMPHLKNTGDMHRIWDSEFLEIDDVLITMSGVAIYIDGNFPDGERNHPYDEAFRSRHGMEILFGDHSPEAAKRIQQEAVERSKRTQGFPILPPAPVRQSIAHRVAERYPVGQVGGYIVDLIHSLNASNLVNPINHNDARLGKAMVNTARANMFLKGAEHGDEVTPRQMAMVAGLVLPTIVELSYEGQEKMEAATERPSTKFEQAVAIRRVIARTAFRTYLGMDALNTEREIAHMTDEAVKKHSYANPEAVSFDVDRALFGGEQVEQEEVRVNSNGRRKFFGISLPRRRA